MILTCPECASRYFIDEARLGPQGRKVRCASCGASWRADAASDGGAAPLTLAPPPPEPSCDTAAETDDAAAARPGERPGDALPKSFRAKAEARRRARNAVTVGATWAAVAASFAVLTLCAVVFRVQVVHVLPRAAGAYAALRLPVNPLGLSPEGVQAAPGLQDGHTMLFVRGMERNVDAAARPPADLRVSLYDKAGQRVASLVAPVAGDPLPAGEARGFHAAFVDPPLSGVQVGVDLIFPPPSRLRSSPTAANAPPPRLRGLAPAPALRLQPVEIAQPLPASSPYALPSAARPQAATD